MASALSLFLVFNCSRSWPTLGSPFTLIISLVKDALFVILSGVKKVLRLQDGLDLDAPWCVLDARAEGDWL